MNAPPNIDSVTAHSGGDVVDWLTNGTRDQRFIDNIFAEMCVRLQQAGIPVKCGLRSSPRLQMASIGSRFAVPDDPASPSRDRDWRKFRRWKSRVFARQPNSVATPAIPVRWDHLFLQNFPNRRA
jgi:hypothetical protein